jgi:hypothetical protein
MLVSRLNDCDTACNSFRLYGFWRTSVSTLALSGKQWPVVVVYLVVVLKAATIDRAASERVAGGSVNKLLHV